MKNSYHSFFSRLCLLRSVFPVVILLTCFSTLQAQDNQFGSWSAWFNNVRFNEKWGMNNDIQFRAGSDWSKSSLLLIRPGINYYISASQTVSAGYAAIINTNTLSGGQKQVAEHRIWEQFIIAGRLAHIPVQHRFRFEQRFLQRPSETVFAQRIRYFLRGIIPLTVPLSSTFSRGTFAALQNELFFNVQNKSKLNGKLFDQNRAYAAFGYRFTARYDLEVGYMNQFILTASPQNNMMTHIAQIAFYTRL